MRRCPKPREGSALQTRWRTCGPQTPCSSYTSSASAQLTSSSLEEKNAEIDDLTEMMMRCLDNAEIEDFLGNSVIATIIVTMVTIIVTIVTVVATITI